jgi:transcriptional regulator with XRE-family HTH domain
MTLSIQFRNYRKGNKITQVQLSKDSGVNRAAIWRFENGHEIKSGSLEKLIKSMGAKMIIINKEI